MNRLYGVKLYDPRFCTSRTVDLLQEAGFNTVYLGRDALVPAFTEELSSRGLFWNIVEPVFLASEGEDLAVLEDGSLASDDWVRFVCPTDAVHLNDIRWRIASDIRTLNPPGVSLDFLRFFQFWEMTSPSAEAKSLLYQMPIPEDGNGKTGILETEHSGADGSDSLLPDQAD